MSFDPTKPVEHTEIDAAELRDQFNGLKTLIDAKLPATEKGAANGVASLDASGRLTQPANWNTLANKPAPASDGTYTVGMGTATNGTITVVNGIITAVQQATNLPPPPPLTFDGIGGYLPDGSFHLLFSHTGDTGAADRVVWGSAAVGGSGSNAMEVDIGAGTTRWGFTFSDVGNDIPFGYQLVSGVLPYRAPVIVGAYSWDGLNPPAFTT